MNTYCKNINKAMRWLGGKKDVVFIGQTVRDGGAAISNTLEGVPMSKRIELPVAEEMQMGMTLGMAMEGFCVVSIYPRIDFLMLAMNQLVNHVDKLGEMSEDKMKARIIIRTSVGPKEPLDAGPQHTQDHSEALALMLHNISVKWESIKPDAKPMIQRCRNVWEGKTLSHCVPGFGRVFDNMSAVLFIEDGSQY